MHLPIFSAKLRRQRDVVLAWQRARQIAGFLGFEPRNRTLIAAAVFEIARKTYQLGGRGTIKFQLQDRILQVFPVCVRRSHAPSAEGREARRQGTGNREHGTAKAAFPLSPIPRPPFPVPCPLSSVPSSVEPVESNLRFETPLPKTESLINWEDLPWLMDELNAATPLGLFDELQQVNQELLRTYKELQACQAELNRSQMRSDSAAA